MLNRSMELENGSLLDLDARATLALAEREVAARRQQGVDRLRLLLHWADLHSEDPQARPGAVPLSKGGDRLIQLGGEGTPKASELCWAELAIALETGVIAVRNQAGQALDLRHRLPPLWTLVKELRIEPWVAQKVAAMTRDLTRDQVALVDAAVAAAVEESPGRILAIAEAKTIEADLEGYRTRLAEDARRPGYGSPGPGPVTWSTTRASRAPGGSPPSCPPPTPSRATRWSTTSPTPSPRTARRRRTTRPPGTSSAPRPSPCWSPTPTPPPRCSTASTPPPSAEEPAPVRPKRKRRPAVINVHLTDQVLSGQVDGIARVEALGPMLLEQVADLVQHRNITVQPVIDLNTGHSVNGYEHPTAVKPRTRLRTVYDVFPHSSSRATGRLDHDHPTPYDPGGPPGQTGDHNDAPLTRFHHRAKTHEGYKVGQLGLGAYRWVTPHGLARVVTPRGTRKVELLRSPRRHHHRRDLPRPRRGLPPADLICGAVTPGEACRGSISAAHREGTGRRSRRTRGVGRSVAPSRRTPST